VVLLAGRPIPFHFRLDNGAWPPHTHGGLDADIRESRTSVPTFAPRMMLSQSCPTLAPGKPLEFTFPSTGSTARPVEASAPFNWDSQGLALQTSCSNSRHRHLISPAIRQGIAVYNGALMNATNKCGFKALRCSSGMVNT